MERDTMDMKLIVSACQLMDKCFEQRVPLHQVFVDLTKVLNTVKRMYSCSTRDLGNLDVLFNLLRCSNSSIAIHV